MVWKTKLWARLGAVVSLALQETSSSQRRRGAALASLCSLLFTTLQMLSLQLSPCVLRRPLHKAGPGLYGHLLLLFIFPQGNPILEISAQAFIRQKHRCWVVPALEKEREFSVRLSGQRTFLSLKSWRKLTW